MAPGRWCCPCFRPETDDITVLEYSHGNLDDVPTEIFSFERTLEELYLDANQIKDLPRPLFHCHGLKKLILSDNEIQSVPPAIASLINLEELDVSKNGILEIPDNIKGCKCLAVVDASANPLVRLPEGFTQLISLEELYLNDTFLEYLPANFGRLSRLKILELRENHLKVLPKSMTRLTELTRLDIGQNDFCEIPDVVGALTKLVELWCDNNKIQKIPACLNNLKRLAYLDASKNKIQELTPDFGLCGNLTDLTLTKNKIKHIPQSIGNLKKLSILRLDCNHLQALPPSIGNLVNLEEVVISFNNILSLPPSIGFLRNMHTFIADDNQLEELPPEIGSCVSLSILSLRNNKLHNVPAEIGHIGKLKVVNLTGNCLHHLPFSIGKLPNLHALWLAENQTKPLIPLQSDVDSSTGQKVLTCFMLPQSPVEQEGRTEVYTPDSEAEREERQIKFAADVSSERSQGKLVRAPTPYPKELKAHARYARNYILKKLEMNGQVRTDGEDIQTRNGPGSLRAVADGMVVAPTTIESPSVLVREAKVTKPMSPINVSSFSQHPISDSSGQVHDDIPTVHCGTENSPPTSGKAKKPKMLPMPPEHIVQQVRTQQPSNCPSAYPRQLPAMQHATISRLCGDVQVPIQHSFRSQSATAMSRSLSNIHQSHLVGRPPAPQKETISEYLHVHPGSPRQHPQDYSPSGRVPNSMKLNSTGDITWFGGPGLHPQYKEEGFVLHQPYRVSGGPNRVAVSPVDVLQDGTMSKSWTSYTTKSGNYTLHPTESGRSSPSMAGGHNLPTYLNVSPTGRERPRNFYPVARSPDSFQGASLADIPHIDESPVNFQSPPDEGSAQHQQYAAKPLSQCLENEERWSYKRDCSPTSMYPGHQDPGRPNSSDGLHPRQQPPHPPQRQHGNWFFGVHRNPLVFPVSIHKSPDLGFTIEGGIGTPKNLNKPDDESIYIDHVVENSRASMVLKPGDKILQVDGIDFTFVDQNKARIVLQSSGPTVNLLISRG